MGQLPRWPAWLPLASVSKAIRPKTQFGRNEISLTRAVQPSLGDGHRPIEMYRMRSLRHGFVAHTMMLHRIYGLDADRRSRVATVCGQQVGFAPASMSARLKPTTSRPDGIVTIITIGVLAAVTARLHARMTRANSIWEVYRRQSCGAGWVNLIFHAARVVLWKSVHVLLHALTAVLPSV